MSGSVTGPHGLKIPILGKGSRFGANLRAGTFQLVQAYRRKPGQLQVRLRLNARTSCPARTASASSPSIRGDGTAASRSASAIAERAPAG